MQSSLEHTSEMIAHKSVFFFDIVIYNENNRDVLTLLLYKYHEWRTCFIFLQPIIEGTSFAKQRVKLRKYAMARWWSWPQWVSYVSSGTCKAGTTSGKKRSMVLGQLYGSCSNIICHCSEKVICNTVECLNAKPRIVMQIVNDEIAWLVFRHGMLLFVICLATTFCANADLADRDPRKSLPQVIHEW
jgi:hypothetical protein